MHELLHLLQQCHLALAMPSRSLMRSLCLCHELSEIRLLLEAEPLSWRAAEHVLVEDQLLLGAIVQLQIRERINWSELFAWQQLLQQCSI